MNKNARLYHLCGGALEGWGAGSVDIQLSVSYKY